MSLPSQSIPLRQLAPPAHHPVTNSAGIRTTVSTTLSLLTHTRLSSAKCKRIHGVLRGREVEVLQEESEQRQLQARSGGRSRRRPVPKAVVERAGCPRDRPARHRIRERLRAAAIVLEPVRGSGEGAAGALLHHAPLRHHARLLEGLADRQQSRHTLRTCVEADRALVLRRRRFSFKTRRAMSQKRAWKGLDSGKRVFRLCVYRSALIRIPFLPFYLPFLGCLASSASSD
jgi:hypothetical protein